MLEIRKRTYFSWWSTILLFTSFSKTLLTSQRRITGRQILAVNISPTFFNTGTTNKTFQQSIKQDPLRHLMKSSTSMYESSGSQFFRTSNGIQSGPDAFHESSSTILEVIQLYSWILCSFRLDLEGKIDNEIPVSSRLEFLEEFLAKNFVNNNRSNTSGPLNRGGIADSRLLRTLLAIPQKSWEPCFWEMMDSFVLVPYACFAASRTLLQKLLGCLSSILDSKVLFCWYKRKKVISINYGSSKNSWKPWKWVRLDLILLMRDIYISYNLN